MMRLERLRLSVLAPVALVAAAFSLLAGPAAAQVDLEADELGSFEIPETAQIFGIDADRDGRTYISAMIGETEEELACLVMVVEEGSATGYEYRYADSPTLCISTKAHPDGGFFARGMMLQNESVFGFTSLFDEEGEELWAVGDDEFADSDDFTGEYQEPNPQMAYSSERDKLLAFSDGELQAGNGASLSQGHVIDVESGSLGEHGRDFTTQGSPGVIAGATTHRSGDRFLVYIYMAGSQGAEFFSYDGRINIDAFKPLGEDWEERFVRQITYGPDENVHVLWTPDDDESQTPTEIAVVDDEEDEVWTERWDSVVEVDFADEELDLGLPQKMRVGAEFTLVLYDTGAGLAVRVVDIETGEEIGIASLEELTDFTPVDIFDGADGGFKLLAVDSDEMRLHEYRLEIRRGEENSGGDAGMADAGDDSSGSSGSSDDGCAAGAPETPAPLSGAVVAIALAVFSIARRTSFLRHPRRA